MAQFAHFTGEWEKPQHIRRRFTIGY